MTEKNILALDLARQTGYAMIVNNGTTISGSTDFTPPRGQMVDHLFVKWHDWLDHWLEPEQIEYVAYEMLSFMPKSKDWRFMYNGMVAILRERCKRLNIPCRGVSEKDIKAAATGKQTAGKPQMIATARAQWPDQQIIDDNQADALWLLYIACKNVGSNVQRHHGELF